MDSTLLAAAAATAVASIGTDDDFNDYLHRFRTAETPQHTHAVQSAVAADNTQAGPQAMWARSSDNASLYHALGTPAPMAGTAVQANGAGWAHNNQSPALALTFIIAMQGVYPPRS